MLLLRESFNRDWNNIQDILPTIIPLTEKNKILSLKEGQVSALSAFKVPVWKLGEENKNKRIYPLSLGEKIVNQSPITASLDGHPNDDDYEPVIKDIIAIAKNPSIENLVLFCEVYTIDEEFDKKMQRALDLGFSFQQSSSGYGELDKNNTVITETYQLERFLDFLITDSSYEVYTKKENQIVIESVEKKEDNRIVKENIVTNNNRTKENKENYDMADEKKNSAEDKLLRTQVRKLIKEAKGIEDLQEKLFEYKEVKSYFDVLSDSELEKEVDGAIMAINEEILSLAEKGKGLDIIVKEKEETIKSLDEANEKIETIKKENTTLQEKIEASNKKLDVAFEEMDKSKSTHIKLKEMYTHKIAESNTLVDPEDYVKLVKHTESLEEEVKTLKEKKVEKVIIPVSSKKKVSLSTLRKVEEKIDAKQVDKKIIEEKKEIPIYTRRHNFIDIEQEDEIIRYYKDLEERYGKSVVPFKEDFMKCKVLSEAQNCFFRHKQFIIPDEDLSRRHLVDRTQGETLREKRRALNLSEDITLDKCKPSGWL